MTNILNLDDLASSDVKTLRLDGIDHIAKEVTVQGYIDRVRRANALPKDAGMDTQIEETVSLLDDLFPTVGKERWMKMSMAHLAKVVDFALQAPEDIVQQVEQAQGNG